MTRVNRPTSDQNAEDPRRRETPTPMEAQVKSKKRVMDHGEVLTGKREVNAMLDLVKQETERIDSRFLDSACGTGNFLTVILERKLEIVTQRYGKSQLDYERYAIQALSSVYGIDILEDNVKECQASLLHVFDANYPISFKSKIDTRYNDTAQFILARNILCGDALTLKTSGDDPQYIVFSEWTIINGSMIKRRDFTFHRLLNHESMKELPIFSDLGEDVFIPTPEREYPPTHYLEIANVHHQQI